MLSLDLHALLRAEEEVGRERLLGCVGIFLFLLGFVGSQGLFILPPGILVALLIALLDGRVCNKENVNKLCYVNKQLTILPMVAQRRPSSLATSVML